MNKSNGRRAINHILEMMEEDEHIEGNFKEFIDCCLRDYLFSKKLSHSLYSLIRFENQIVDISKIKEAIKEVEEKENE